MVRNIVMCMYTQSLLFTSSPPLLLFTSSPPLLLFTSSPPLSLLLLPSSSSSFPSPSLLLLLLFPLFSSPPPLTGDGSVLQHEQLLLKCRLILSQLSTGNNLIQVYVYSNIMKRISNEVRIIVIFIIIIIIIIILGSDKQIA